MCYCPTPTLHLNLALTGDGAFLLSPQKTHSVWFISILNYGDTENVLINDLLLVIPMSYLCHYTNLCPHKPHKPHKHAHTHTHTHTYIPLILFPNYYCSAVNTVTCCNYCKKKSSCIYYIYFKQDMFSFWSEKWSGPYRFYEIHLDIMNTMIWHRRVKILSVVLTNVCQKTHSEA